MIICGVVARAEEDDNFPKNANAHLAPVFDEWSAYSLSSGSFSLGSVTDIGIASGFMAGVDPMALALGVKTAEAKWQLPIDGNDQWAIGLKYAWFNRRSLYSETIRKHFDELDGRFIRPSIAWSSQISARLTIHTFWATGFGSAHAVLSNYGKRELWKAKHGDTTFPGDQPSANTSSTSTTANQQTANQDADSTFAKRTMQLQSIAGFTEDRFQITGDWQRDDGNRVLLSTRLERTKLESLETFSVRITIAQEWTLDHFHLRMGGGPQYAMLSGKDLDGEEIKAAGWLPAADLAVFWLF